MQLEVKAYIKLEVERIKQVTCLTPKDATLVDSIIKLINYTRVLDKS